MQRPPFCPWPPLPLPGSDAAHQEPASKGTDLPNQPGHTQHRHFLEVSWPLTLVTCLSLSSQPWSSVKGAKGCGVSGGHSHMGHIGRRNSANPDPGQWLKSCWE